MCIYIRTYRLHNYTYNTFHSMTHIQTDRRADRHTCHYITLHCTAVEYNTYPK